MHTQPQQTQPGAASATASSGVTATLVPNHQRMTFLPRLFGPKLMLQGEHAVYDWMGKLCTAYHGGYWNYFHLSNGGGFMALRAPNDVHLVSPNGFDATVSPEVSGIVVTVFALNSLIWKGHEAMFRPYDALQDFIRTHPHSADIRRLTD